MAELWDITIDFKALFRYINLLYWLNVRILCHSVLDTESRIVVSVLLPATSSVVSSSPQARTSREPVPFYGNTESMRVREHSKYGFPRA